MEIKFITGSTVTAQGSYIRWAGFTTESAKNYYQSLVFEDGRTEHTKNMQHSPKGNRELSKLVEQSRVKLSAYLNAKVHSMIYCDLALDLKCIAQAGKNIFTS